MILLVGGETKLPEDARHVLLDRAQRHHHLLGDRLVRAALRHQLEHLALARRQLRERIVAAPPADEPRDHLRVERGAAVRDPFHRGGELLHVGDAVLEQVADALGVSLEQLERVAGLDVLREHEHADSRVALADLLRGAEPLVGVGRRHPDVDDRDVRRSTTAPSGAARRRLPAWPTISKPASSSRRAMPSRRSTESSAITTRVRAPRPRLLDVGAQRREDGRAGDVELVDPLRPLEPAQPVLAEVAQLRRRRRAPRGPRRRGASGRRARPCRCGRRGGRRARRSRRRRARDRRCGCRCERARRPRAPAGSRAPSRPRRADPRTRARTRRRGSRPPPRARRRRRRARRGGAPRARPGTRRRAAGRGVSSPRCR